MISFSISLVFPPGGSAYCQQNADTMLIRQWIDSAREIQYTQYQVALAFGKKVFAASQPAYYYGLLNGLQVIGEAFYLTGQQDSAIYYYRQALQCARDQGDVIETANNFTSLASIFQETGNPDSALSYFADAIYIFEEYRDSNALSDALLRFGNVQSSIGSHEEALSTFMRTLRISEALDRRLYIGYSYGSIGMIHDKQGNYEKAEEYFLKAKELFTELGNIYGQIGMSNNLGILYKNMGAYEKSMDAYTLCLMLSDSANYDRGKLSAHTNLGILHDRMGQFETAVYHARLGLQYAGNLQVRESYADNLNSLARAQMGLQQYSDAVQNAGEALRIGTEVGSLEKQRDATHTLSDIARAMHDYENSLTYYIAYTEIKDSLYNTGKSEQISRLQTIYESEKKDKEILLLAKNAEIDRIRKTRLWVALGLSLLAGALLMYAQRSRRIRDRKILSQQRELEAAGRKAAELERDKVTRVLEYKKQELAAKALQLARKNTFLQSLNTQVEQMKAHAEGAIADSARQISRQIRTDIESEEDWDRFLTSFREVHRDFIDNLVKAYPVLSKGEVRLACLMKMNLSAKELAAMLNVTPDGIKKARYRLRKKMGLDSDVDIQQYLLAFPQEHISTSGTET